MSQSQSQSQRDITADALSQCQPHQCGRCAGSHCGPLSVGSDSRCDFTFGALGGRKERMRKMENDRQRCELHHRWEDRSSLVYRTTATWQNRERKRRGRCQDSDGKREMQVITLSLTGLILPTHDRTCCVSALRTVILIITSYFINIPFLLKFSCHNPQMCDMRWECLDTFPIVIFRSASIKLQPPP